jgi:hypothetical protein
MEQVNAFKKQEKNYHVFSTRQVMLWEWEKNYMMHNNIQDYPQ